MYRLLGQYSTTEITKTALRLRADTRDLKSKWKQVFESRFEARRCLRGWMPGVPYGYTHKYSGVLVVVIVYETTNLLYIMPFNLYLPNVAFIQFKTNNTQIYMEPTIPTLVNLSQLERAYIVSL